MLHKINIADILIIDHVCSSVGQQFTDYGSVFAGVFTHLRLVHGGKKCLQQQRKPFIRLSDSCYTKFIKAKVYRCDDRALPPATVTVIVIMHQNVSLDQT